MDVTQPHPAQALPALSSPTFGPSNWSALPCQPAGRCPGDSGNGGGGAQQQRGGSIAAENRGAARAGGVPWVQAQPLLRLPWLGGRPSPQVTVHPWERRETLRGKGASKATRPASGQGFPHDLDPSAGL